MERIRTNIVLFCDVHDRSHAAGLAYVLSQKFAVREILFHGDTLEEILIIGENNIIPSDSGRLRASSEQVSILVADAAAVLLLWPSRPLTEDILLYTRLAAQGRKLIHVFNRAPEQQAHERALVFPEEEITPAYTLGLGDIESIIDAVTALAARTTISSGAEETPATNFVRLSNTSDVDEPGIEPRWWDIHHDTFIMAVSAIIFVGLVAGSISNGEITGDTMGAAVLVTALINLIRRPPARRNLRNG